MLVYRMLPSGKKRYAALDWYRKAEKQKEGGKKTNSGMQDLHVVSILGILIMKQRARYTTQK